MNNQSASIGDINIEDKDNSIGEVNNEFNTDSSTGFRTINSSNSSDRGNNSSNGSLDFKGTNEGININRELNSEGLNEDSNRGLNTV